MSALRALGLGLGRLSRRLAAWLRDDGPSPYAYVYTTEVTHRGYLVRTYGDALVLAQAESLHEGMAAWRQHRDPIKVPRGKVLYWTEHP